MPLGGQEKLLWGQEKLLGHICTILRLKYGEVSRKMTHKGLFYDTPGLTHTVWQIISKAEFPEIEHQRNLCKNGGGLYLAAMTMIHLHIII